MHEPTRGRVALARDFPTSNSLAGFPLAGGMAGVAPKLQIDTDVKDSYTGDIGVSTRVP